MTVVVRPAQAAELTEAGQLVARAYVDDGLLSSDDSYFEVLQDAVGRARDSLVLVAIEDGDMVGTVTWCPPSSSHREVAGPDEGEFRSLGVNRASRGRGVAQLLVRECMDRARADRLRGIAIYTASRMNAAQRLYERLGFDRTPDKDWLLRPDLLLLAYRLDLERS